MKTISAIVVTYNSNDVIRECLHNLVMVAKELPLEIIVIDNDSTDETPSIVSQEFPSVKLIHNNNTGYGAGNNRGFEAATGEYIAIINPDLIINTPALKTLVTHLQQNPTVGILGPKQLDGNGDLIASAYPPYSPWRSLGKYFGLERFSPKFVYSGCYHRAINVQEPFGVGWVGGACLVIPREVYQQLQGFDEDFFLFAEDIDICERAQSNGWEVTYMPNTIVTHYASTSVSKTPFITTLLYHTSPLLYFRKRGRKKAVYLLKLGYSIELLIKIIKRLLKGIVFNNKTSLADAQIHWRVLVAMLQY
jgi:GT2 family glycosyltransferase